LAQQVLTLGVGVFGLVALLGYAYDVQALYRFAGYSSMALHTAAGFVVLATGLIFARADGLAQLLVVPGPGGQLARRFLPVAILLPAVVGLFHELGERSGVWNAPVGAGLFAIVMMASLFAAVWWIAWTLDRYDAARRETETQLHNQAELMNLAREGLIVRELNGGAIRTWNRGAEALYGWSGAEALGRNIHTLLRTEGVDLAELNAQLERTGRWEGELIHTTRDGRRIAVESLKTASRTADGRVLILESNRDITARKRVENALRQSAKKLRTLYSSMVEGLATHKIVYEEGKAVDYIVTGVNPAFERITGLTRSATVGRRASEIYGTGKPPYLEVYAKVAAGGAPEHFETFFAPMGKHFAISVASPEEGTFATVFT
jgi:PAS domain S-box-containing protein